MFLALDKIVEKGILKQLRNNIIIYSFFLIELGAVDIKVARLSAFNLASKAL